MKDVLVYFLLGMAALGLGLGVASSLDLETLCFDRDDKASVSYLYVQEAAGGDIALNEDDTYTLTLSGVSRQTLVFTDRPVRDAFHLSTVEFADTFASLFFDGPPNAALAYEMPGEVGTPETLVLTLGQPVFDEASGKLTYTAVEVAVDDGRGAPSEGETPLEAPMSFGAASLFLDAASATAASTSWELTVYGSQDFVDHSPPGQITATFDGQTQSLVDSDGWALNATFTGSGDPPTGDLVVYIVTGGPDDGYGMHTASDRMGWNLQGNVWKGRTWPIE